MTKFENKHIALELKNDIIFADYKSECITLPMVDEGIDKRLEIISNKSYPICADIRKTEIFTKEARLRLAQEDATWGTTACAVIVNSRIQEFIYNLFFTNYKYPVPTKLFANKEKAIMWLEQFKQ